MQTFESLSFIPSLQKQQLQKPVSGLKRKRRIHNDTSWPDGNENDYEEDFDELVDDINTDSSSNSSSDLSTNSSGSYTIKANKVQHGHKMLITEEKVTNALRNLCVQQSSVCPSNLVNDLEHLNDDEEEDGFVTNDFQDNSIQLSDELKQTLKEYNRSLLETIKRSPSVNNNGGGMQLVVWSPKIELAFASPTENENDEEDEENEGMIEIDSTNEKTTNVEMAQLDGGGERSINPYRVQEPHESTTNNNKLKRKYSQLNKLAIEEMNVNDTDPATTKASFYLVDQEHDDDNGHLLYLSPNQKASNLKITEITSNSNVNNMSETARLNSEEKMDI